MKPILTFLAAVAFTTLAGCRNVGYNDRSLNNSLTPDVSQKEYVRTYDQSGNPTVTPVTPAAKTDPASPDYSGPDGVK